MKVDERLDNLDQSYGKKQTRKLVPKLGRNAEQD